MDKKIYITGLIFIFLISFISAELVVGDVNNDNKIVELITDIPINVTTTDQTFNMSDFWITNEGNMDNVPDLYPTLDLRYLQLDGSNFGFDDLFISYSDPNFDFNESHLNLTIDEFGYNVTTELTEFYDLRYLTAQLNLYFYNRTDNFNSSYTIMNTTIPTGDSQVDRFTSMSPGSNLLTKRILSTLNLTLLQAGAYNQHTTIDFISGTKDVQLRSEIRILFANTTETQIGLSPNSSVLVNGVLQQVTWTGAIAEDRIFPEGSKLTMYLYAVVSGLGSAPTIDLVVADETASRLDVGINPTDIRINEIDPFALYFDGSVQPTGNFNWNNFNITNLDYLSARVLNASEVILGDVSSGEDIFIYFNDDALKDEYFKWDDSSDWFEVSDGFNFLGAVLAQAVISSGDIRTTGTGDDLWLGSSTQGSALFQALADGNVIAINSTTEISFSDKYIATDLGLASAPTYTWEGFEDKHGIFLGGTATKNIAFVVEGTTVLRFDDSLSTVESGLFKLLNDGEITGFYDCAEENNDLTTGFVFSWGNGVTGVNNDETGILMFENGTVEAMSINCESATGTTTTVEVTLNGASTSGCQTDLDTAHDSGAVYGVDNCGLGFDQFDILNINVEDIAGGGSFCKACIQGTYHVKM